MRPSVSSSALSDRFLRSYPNLVSSGTWKAPVLPRDLSSFMSDMSLKPEVEATLIGDVSATFKDSHELMVTELRNLLKDKIRMAAK